MWTKRERRYEALVNRMLSLSKRDLTVSKIEMDSCRNDYLALLGDASSPREAAYHQVMSIMSAWLSVDSAPSSSELKEMERQLKMLQDATFEDQMEDISPQIIKSAEQVLVDNGIEADEASTVLQALGYVLLSRELYP